jgi:hypothetical protein
MRYRGLQSEINPDDEPEAISTLSLTSGAKADTTGPLLPLAPSSWGRRFAAVGRSCTAAAHALAGFAQLARYGMVVPTIRRAFTQTQGKTERAPDVVVLHIAGYLSANHARNLGLANMEANAVVQPALPSLAYATEMQRQVDLDKKIAKAKPGPEQFNLVREHSGSRARLLLIQRKRLERLDPAKREAEVHKNRTELQAALLKATCPLPKDHLLPGLASDPRKSLNELLPKSLGRYAGTIQFTNAGDIRFVKPTTHGFDLTFTMNRKELENWAAVLGSSIEHVVEWMTKFNDADALSKLLSDTDLAGLPIPHEVGTESD